MREGRAGGARAARAGSAAAILVAGAETGGRFALVELRERGGAGPPRHLHTREDELVYVLEGEVTFHKGGQRLECWAGDSLYLPRGCEHAYRVESDRARLLVLLMPAGLEGYYGELGRTQDVFGLITVSARHGVVITGPKPDDGGGGEAGSSDGEGGDWYSGNG